MTRKEWYEKWLPHMREALAELITEVDDPAMMAGRWVVEDEDETPFTLGAWMFLIGPTTDDILQAITTGRMTYHIGDIDDLDDAGNTVIGPEDEQ